MHRRGEIYYEFEDFRLDPRARSLTRSGQEVPLRPKSFDVLACLLLNSGEMVAKDTLLAEVWPGIIASDESLSRCVSDIRNALGDTTRRIIRTVPGRGYLFCPEVAVRSQGVPDGRGNGGNRSRAIAGFGLAAVLVSALIIATMLPAQTPGPLQMPAKQASIVVLPFENHGADPAQDYFADGLTDDIATDLSQVTGLFVIARNSAFAYEGRKVDPRQVSRELGVDHVLEGSVRRMGNLLRINVQLVDGRTGGHIWAQRYDGSLDDVFAFQDSVIANVVSSLKLRLDPEANGRSRLAETENPEAYDAFLEGWAHYLERTPEDYASAARLFRTAVEIDPDYGRAYAALASTYWEAWERWWFEELGFTNWYGPRREAERVLAIALQRPTALAHGVASEVRRQQGRFDEMLGEARAAVQMDPNDPSSYVSLVFALGLYGRHKEALAFVDHAMKLDPHYPAFFLYQKGFVLFSLRRYEEAAEYLERALQRNPANYSPNTFLIATYARLDRLEDARTRLASHPHKLSLDWVRYYYRYRNQEDEAHLLDGLKLAGVPAVATEIPPPPTN